ncbi:MAG: hypothetical protein GKR93_09555 [Gammaproteobacteria bacterium]|nr:hypothetical protein [Gammaproteobacteria bacterium]
MRPDFIHRDIKPPNIFIRADGTPVLLDFGSARQSLGELTRTLTSMVSPGFAPFEQYISKSDKQGPWTDIYGLGATLYRSVIGRSPAEAMDRSEALLHTNRDSFVGAEEINPEGYSAGFLKAIDHALAFKGEDRPQSIGEWRAELSEEFIENDSSSANTDTRPPNATVPEKITINADSKNGEDDTILVSKPERQSWYRKPLKLIAVGFGIVLLLAIIDDNKKENSDSKLERDNVVAKPAEGFSDKILQPELTDSVPVIDKITDEPVGVEVAGIDSVFEERDRKKLERLKKVLAQSSDNDKARREVRKVFAKYEEKVREAFQEERYNVAASYVEEMLALAPENKKLLDLQKTLKAKRAKK